MAEEELNWEEFKNMKYKPDSVSNLAGPQKQRMLHRRQLGILDVIEKHIGGKSSWLTVTQIKFLHQVFSDFATDKTGRLDVTELCHKMQIQPATMNRIIQTFSGNKSMKKDIEWFYTVANPTDNRKILLVLKPTGEALMKDLEVAMQAETYRDRNEYVDVYANVEKAKKDGIAMYGQGIMTDAPNVGTATMTVDTGDFQMKGSVGNVTIKTENNTETVSFRKGVATDYVMDKLTNRLMKKQEYEAWLETEDGRFWKNETTRADGSPKSLLNTMSQVFSPDNKPIKPPVSYFDLNMQDGDVLQLAQMLVAAMQEQDTTRHREELVAMCYTVLTQREYNLIKNHLRQHKDDTDKLKNWLDEETKRLAAKRDELYEQQRRMSGQIQVSSERHQFMADAYAERYQQEQADKEKLEQLREQIAGELRVTLREEVREEVRQELLKKLL